MNHSVSTPAAGLRQPIRKGIKSSFIRLKQHKRLSALTVWSCRREMTCRDPTAAVCVWTDDQLFVFLKGNPDVESCWCWHSFMSENRLLLCVYQPLPVRVKRSRRCRETRPVLSGPVILHTVLARLQSSLFCEQSEKYFYTHNVSSTSL